MNPHQLAWFRARLLALRAELESTLPRVPAPRECGDDVDHAVAAHARERFWHDRARGHATLDEVRLALQRIDAGTYGFCAETGRPIGIARLEANPAAIYTVDVQARRELAHRAS